MAENLVFVARAVIPPLLSAPKSLGWLQERDYVMRVISGTGSVLRIGKSDFRPQAGHFHNKVPLGAEMAVS